jgi:hypothetical protein
MPRVASFRMDASENRENVSLDERHQKLERAARSADDTDYP